MLLLCAEADAPSRVAVGDKVDETIAQIAAGERRRTLDGIGSARRYGAVGKAAHQTPSNSRIECVLGGGCSRSGTTATATATMTARTMETRSDRERGRSGASLGDEAGFDLAIVQPRVRRPPVLGLSGVGSRETDM